MHDSFNVKTYGARGDGESIDHQAIQQALNACAAAGGGTVLVPAGTYLCGSLELKSHTCLYLDMGARLLSCELPELYPEICKTPYGNLPGQIHALIRAENAEHIRVAGPGIIDGGHPEALSPSDAVGQPFRPALVFIRDCHDVTFVDVTLQWSSFWTLHLQRCDDVQVRGITIRNNPGRINTDGIDPDGCRNVTISDCNITGGDDCICIKSTEGDPCENITINNCILQTRCAALKIGTEAIGDIRNITFNNCVVRDSRVALALYMKDGSTYENMIFSNMVIESSDQFPIMIDNTPRYYKEPKVGKIRAITFENLIVTSPGRVYVEGLAGQPIENLSFINISWNVTGPLTTEAIRKPCGARRTEPDPASPNYADAPYHLTATHVRDLDIQGFRLYDRTNDGTGEARGFARLVDVTEGRLARCRPLATPNGIEQISQDGCRNIELPRAFRGKDPLR